MTHPNLFLLGAQKAGTTYLAKVFANHPDILFSDPKETMFFTQKDAPTPEAYAAYCEQYFSGHAGETWIGDGSTTYLQRPKAMQNIQKHVPGTPKFIVCMRQPVDKGMSFFVHNWRRGRYDAGTPMRDTFDLSISLSPLKSSRYANSIERWLEAYPREAFLFMTFDDLKADPMAFVRQATDFLGVDAPSEVPAERINVGKPIEVHEDALVVQSGKADVPPLRVDIEDLKTLRKRCRRDVERTAELTGLNLDHWAKMPDFTSMP